jgi:peptidoglycan/xylan/chitin deacetylase (PgdA/CDA1 family)
MNKGFYKISEITKAIIPLKTLKGLTGHYNIFPFYHTVSDKDLLHIKYLYPVRSVKQFERDLDFFLKNYESIEMSVLLDCVRRGETLKKNHFLLSFDDGLAEFYEVIAPVLLKKGIPATCFLNSGFIDNKDLFFRYKASVLIEVLRNREINLRLKNSVLEWFRSNGLTASTAYRSLLSVSFANREILDELAGILDYDFQDYLKDKKPYLSSEQVLELMDKGFSFGAHSINHPQYSEIDLKDQIHQTKESMDEVESLFDLGYRVFSFPFTDYNVSKSFFDKVYSPDYGGLDLSFGCSGLKNDPCNRNIQRIPMETGNFSAKSIVTGEYLYYMAKSVFNKNIIKRN